MAVMRARSRRCATNFREFGLIRYRIRIELAWLKALADEPGIPEVPAFSQTAMAAIDRVDSTFAVDDAARVKEIERTTNHDVKAVEYWLREHFAAEPRSRAPRSSSTSPARRRTSTISRMAWHSSSARTNLLLPMLRDIAADLRRFAHTHAAVPMLARTHGQAATPTTLGKEFANVYARVERQIAAFERVPIKGKINGAVGNYNAHVVAYPDVDWERLAAKVVAGLGLEFNPYTTQIEPHDYMAEYFDALARTGTILMDLDRDIWGYVSLGYFRQRLAEGEVGSSTMPHKVNPIDFENSEATLALPMRCCAISPRSYPSRAGSAISPIRRCCATWAWHLGMRCSVGVRCARGLPSCKSIRHASRPTSTAIGKYWPSPSRR